MKAVRHRSSWLVTIALACAACAYLLLYFLPRMRDLTTAHREIHRKREFVVSCDKSRALTEHLRKEAAETEEYVERWAEHIVPRHKIPWLLGTVNRLAQGRNIVTQRFEPLPASQFDSVQKVPVMFVGAGNFADCQALLADIEQLPAAIWLEEVKLEKVSESGQGMRCELLLAIFADQQRNSD